MQDRFSIRLGLVVDWLMFKDTVEAFGRQEFRPESNLTKFAYLADYQGPIKQKSYP